MIPNTAEKTQLIRLLDVFVFGPLMVAGAVDQRNKYFKVALTVIGIGTIVYNGINYLENEKQKQADAGELGQRIAPDPRRMYRRPRG